MPLTAALLVLQGIAECIRCWGRAFGPGGEDEGNGNAGPDAPAVDAEGSVIT
jgi:TRAP-type mannitol/chloroaromatic compound transport system permease small subunit